MKKSGILRLETLPSVFVDCAVELTPEFISVTVKDEEFPFPIQPFTTAEVLENNLSFEVNTSGDSVVLYHEKSEVIADWIASIHHNVEECISNIFLSAKESGVTGRPVKYSDSLSGDLLRMTSTGYEFVFITLQKSVISLCTNMESAKPEKVFTLSEETVIDILFGATRCFVVDDLEVFACVDEDSLRTWVQRIVEIVSCGESASESKASKRKSRRIVDESKTWNDYSSVMDVKPAEKNKSWNANAKRVSVRLRDLPGSQRDLGSAWTKSSIVFADNVNGKSRNEKEGGESSKLKKKQKVVEEMKDDVVDRRIYTADIQLLQNQLATKNEKIEQMESEISQLRKKLVNIQIEDTKKGERIAVLESLENSDELMSQIEEQKSIIADLEAKVASLTRKNEVISLRSRAFDEEYRGNEDTDSIQKPKPHVRVRAKSKFLKRTSE